MPDMEIKPGTRVIFMPVFARVERGNHTDRKPTAIGTVTEIYDRFFVVEYGQGRRECFYPDDVKEKRIAILGG